MTSSRTELATIRERRRRERASAPARTLGFSSERTARVNEAADADRARKRTRAAALIALARRRQSAQPIPDRSPSDEAP